MSLTEIFEGLTQMWVDLPVGNSQPAPIRRPVHTEVLDELEDSLTVSSLPDLTALDPDIAAEELKRERKRRRQ